MLPLFRTLLPNPRNMACGRKLCVCPIVQNNNAGNTNIERKKMDDYFLEKRVQRILYKITGMDLEKIFRPVKQPFSNPVMKFVTDKFLENLRREARIKAFKKLQMPPIMEIKEDKEEILSYDPELQGYEDTTQLFIDTSPNVPERQRIITVREPDGTLRKANSKERFRMNQIFFPREGRHLIVPKLFESPYLDKLLDEESYIFVLDNACLQFDPDEADYHRVTHTIYEHIRSRKKFDVLRSTRHFGPMSFYFAWNNKIESLLVDMIERELIEDASDLIKLLYILHPEWGLEEEMRTSDRLALVTDFIARNSSMEKPHLELAFQTYMEVRKNLEERNSVEANSSS